jgi:hypothetical protein
MFKKVKKLIEKARKCEREADALLKELLPEGTEVRFLYGNMRIEATAKVVYAEVFRYPEVLLKNLETGKRRRVPLSAIMSVKKKVLTGEYVDDEASNKRTFLEREVFVSVY